MREHHPPSEAYRDFWPPSGGLFFFSFICQKDAEVRKTHWRSLVFLNQENIALGALKT
jgi:hypothetical protein